MKAKKKNPGGNLTRTQIVTVRLDPKLRYLAELAAKKQRRTLSSYIEWAVQDSLSRVILYEDPEKKNPSVNVQQEADRLWDVDESDRFVRLALNYPELLTHDEQIKWKLIRENSYLWRGNLVDGILVWQVAEQNFDFYRLRKHWDTFCAVANGELDPSVLPALGKTKE